MLPSRSLANALLHASHVMSAVISGRSLADGLLQSVPADLRPAVQDLVYSTLRAYGQGDALLTGLLEKPLAVPEIRSLLLLALNRLSQRPDAAHTTVDQAVTASAELAAGRFRSLVNAILRRYLREETVLQRRLANMPVVRHRHPDWWIRQVQSDHPDRWQAILDAGNLAPPMALRVNLRQTTAAAYLEILRAAGIGAQIEGRTCVLLDHPCPIEALPHFAEGWVSVQDPGAQRAATVLAPAEGARVLDACAAPGGKTAHLLEQASLDLLALDLKPNRCRRIEDNLQRLQLSARVQVGDCLKPENWWDGRPFDAILADVPCSASGVARRNPDIKWLRRPEDIASFARTQAKILRALWPLLKPGGRLLYATCSVFAQENQQQLARFLEQAPEAEKLLEEQILPDATRDGFYYGLLHKRA